MKTSFLLILAVTLLPSFGHSHGKTLKTVILQKNTFKKQLHKGQLVSCETTEGGNQQRITFRNFISPLSLAYPESRFLATGTNLKYCEEIAKLFGKLNNDWESITLNVTRTFGRLILLEAQTCQLYDYYEDDLSDYGFKGTYSYSLQHETLGVVPENLSSEKAQEACLNLYQDSLKNPASNTF